MTLRDAGQEKVGEGNRSVARGRITRKRKPRVARQGEAGSESVSLKEGHTLKSGNEKRVGKTGKK